MAFPILSFWRNLTRKRAVERELADEIGSYLDLATRSKIREGMSPADARRQALREIGGIEQIKEQVRSSRAGFGIETLLGDLRYACRALLKKPGFALTAVVTLALGIGANTAIFTVVHGVLLKSLPFREPEQIVAVGELTKSDWLGTVPYENYRDWRTQQHVFEGMAARLAAGGIINGGREPERIFGRFVSASFFPTLGITPQLGRFFTEAEDEAGGERVMVISDVLWRRHFDADPAVIGKAVQYNAESWVVVGVMPRNFDFYGRENVNNDIFIPLEQAMRGRATSIQQSDSNGRGYPIAITARLKRGVTLRAARAEMQTLARRSAAQFPQTETGNPIEVRPFLADYVGNTAQGLGVISAGVIFLLLIACANVANLTLARATSREREIAVRLALGASRLRVVRLLVTESLLLAFVGSAAGVALAVWAVDVLKTVASQSLLPRISDVHVDSLVLATTALIAIASGTLFGLAPALQASRPDIESALKNGGRGAAGGGSSRLRNALVVAELALSLMLLIAAGLLVESFRHVANDDAGFDPTNVLTFRLRLPDARYPDPQQAIGAVREAERRFRAVPGVTAVAIATGYPFGRYREARYQIEGTPEPKTAAQLPSAVSLATNETYHRTLGVRLLAGREFTERDRADTPPVAIVDDEFVRRNVGAASYASVIGRRLRFEGADEPWREIVGIVAHVKYDTLDELPTPEIYWPWTQWPVTPSGPWLRAMDFVIKTAQEPRALVPAITRTIHEIDPDQPLGPWRTLDSLFDESIAPRRLNLAVITAFSVTALVLSAVGLYGVMSYAVGQRRRELGIRIALGATRRDILRLVVANGMALTLIGLAVGMLGAIAATRLMTSMLFGVTTTDPFTFFMVSGLLAAIALFACYLPARKATRIDPTIALRSE
ncbi:MAG: ADOP family duplicated permease [Chthoniobacterales bacterium]